MPEMDCVLQLLESNRSQKTVGFAYSPIAYRGPTPDDQTRIADTGYAHKLSTNWSQSSSTIVSTGNISLANSVFLAQFLVLS